MAAPLSGHGGRLSAAQAAFPRAPSRWLDLSTGINPQPYPAPRPAARSRARLPEPEDVQALERIAAEAFGAHPDHVCATAGSDLALRLVALALGVRSAAVVAPTYAGHADAWRAVDAEVDVLPRPECGAEALAATVLERGSQALVLANPNNPDGRRLPRKAVLRLTAGLARAGCWLVVDEAFADVAPGLSVAGDACGKLVVTRSFGKFYGLAGVRLGFVLGAPELLARVRRLQGDWPVSADALAAGTAAYTDAGWAQRTRTRLARDGARLDALLGEAGYDVLGGATLFRLARADDARRRFVRLAERGVLVRAFDEFPDRLRFGLPPPHAWRRLETALKESAA